MELKFYLTYKNDVTMAGLKREDVLKWRGPKLEGPLYFIKSLWSLVNMQVIMLCLCLHSDDAQYIQLNIHVKVVCMHSITITNARHYVIICSKPL